MPLFGAYSTQAIRQYLESEDTFATVLVALAIDNYGMEVFEWEPETLRLEFQADFGARIPKINNDKIWAFITSITTNQFYRSWEFFSETCDVLNGSEADFNNFNPLTPEDLVWGVSEIALNDTYEKELENMSFSEEIKNFVGIILDENGIWEPPSVLKFAVLPSGAHSLEDAMQDELLFEASFQIKQNRVLELNNYVKENIRQLRMQLRQVPLRNRDQQSSDKELSA